VTKLEKIQNEEKRIAEVFREIDPTKAELARGIIQQAAFLKIENDELQEQLLETGMVKYHPERKDIQKPMEGAKQFRQNAATYNLLIKTLGSMIGKDDQGGDDPFDEWIKQKNRDKSKQAND